MMKTESSRCRETPWSRAGAGSFKDTARELSGGGNRIGGAVDAIAVTAANDGAVGLASSGSPAAQQLSASGCVSPRVAPGPSASDVCIGQAAPSRQQAIRASGVACQPPHRLTGPADMMATSTAATARAMTSTSL